MLTGLELDAIRQFDTCTISDAIEQFSVRLRNEGFTRPGLRCFTQTEPHVLGYAATFRVRSSDPPVTGGAFLDRTDWWEEIERLPTPRVAVIRDLEPIPSGSSVGEIHAAVLKGLGCEGVITNGAVRDLPALKRLGFPMFAQYVAVSHSYMHVIDYGAPVEILGLEIHSGDLIHADCHGAVVIPLEIAGAVAKVAAQIRSKEARIVQACISTDSSRSPEEFKKELLELIQGNRQ